MSSSDKETKGAEGSQLGLSEQLKGLDLDSLSKEDLEAQVVKVLESVGLKVQPREENGSSGEAGPSGSTPSQKPPSGSSSTSSGDAPKQPVVWEGSSYLPRLSVFTGEDSKGSVTFLQWKGELVQLAKSEVYQERILRTAARRSLKGDAGEVMDSLGDGASVMDIISKLEGYYGVVEDGTTLVQQFWQLRQGFHDSVSKYARELEVALTKATKKGGIGLGDANKALCAQFWKGLRDERVRNALRGKKEGECTFDELVRHGRAIEREVQDFENSSKGGKGVTKAQNNQVSVAKGGEPQKPDPLLKELGELKSMVVSLTSRVGEMEGKLPAGGRPYRSGRGKPQAPTGDQGPKLDEIICFRCKGRGHYARNCLAPNPVNTSREETSPPPSSAQLNQGGPLPGVK